MNELDIKIESSTASDEDRNYHLMKERDDLYMYTTMDISQKARIRWDVEGDENTKFFHGIIKMKHRNHIVQGVLVDGECYSNPNQVKEAFYNFYQEKFQAQEAQLNATYNSGFSSLDQEDANDQQRTPSTKEIRSAVWACGSDKSLGPNGLSFIFLKKYWDYFKGNVEKFILDFMKTDSLPRGTNSAFITLIPKVINPLLIKEYNPISLIGMQYKIIAKLLTIHLAKVLDNIVSPVQSVFISGRQILDGPLMAFKGAVNTQCASNILDPLSQKLDDENVSLEFQVMSLEKENEHLKVDNLVPNKHVKASIRTKSITVSQPHVITKKDMNSNSNDLSSTRVESTAKTRRPQPRSNTKNDRKHKAKARRSKKLGSKESLASPRLLQAYNKEFEAAHQLRLEVYGNCLGHNLFWVGQYCDSDLEVAFKRNSCFVKNLDGVDLLKGNRSINLYTINLHELTSASPGKSKKSPYKPKHVPNSKNRLHLLHMNLCGPMRVERINGKWYVLVIMDAYSPPVIIVRTDNVTEFTNQVLKAYFKDVGISHQTSSVRTPQQVESLNKEIRHISFLHVFGALYDPKNDRKDIRKLGAKGDIGFFLGYSATSRAYRIYNRRTNKIIEMMNVTFDELSAMAFEQRSSKPELQGRTSRKISSGIDLTYDPSTITSQKPTERELELLFEELFLLH
ncbi:retrovirus-related pol polyprotein from transposon TNT 1-94 [Tanacetum coccineum]